MLFFIGLLKVVLVIVCILLVLLVMMQRPKQEGLGAAFAQGMMNEIGGAHTANILQKGTTYLGVMFFAISLLLSVLISYEARADRALGEAAAESVSGKSGETAGQPTDPLNFNPDLGNIPGVDTPLGGIPGDPETGTNPETGTDPGAGTNPDTGTKPDEGTNPEAGENPDAGTKSGEENGGSAGEATGGTAGEKKPETPAGGVTSPDPKEGEGEKETPPAPPAAPESPSPETPEVPAGGQSDPVAPPTGS